MATNAGGLTDGSAQAKFIDAVIASIVLPDGTKPAAAPNAWKSREQKQLTLTTKQFSVEFRTMPDGSAWAKVVPVGQGESISGTIDLVTLATKLV